MNDDAETTETCALWPEHLLPFNLLCSMATQWNVGFSGAIGLRYEVLPMLLDAEGVPAGDRAQVISDLQEMERAQLRYMRKE